MRLICTGLNRFPIFPLVSNFDPCLDSPVDLPKSRSLFHVKRVFATYHFPRNLCIMDDHAQPTIEFPNQSDVPHDQLPEGLSAPRRRLGRGLSSLLGGLENWSPAGSMIMEEGQAAETPIGEFSLIDEAAISRNPFQPRKDFAEESLAEMVASISQHGVLQPLLVRVVEGAFQLHRWRATAAGGAQGRLGESTLPRHRTR